MVQMKSSLTKTHEKTFLKSVKQQKKTGFIKRKIFRDILSKQQNTSLINIYELDIKNMI